MFDSVPPKNLFVSGNLTLLSMGIWRVAHPPTPYPHKCPPPHTRILYIHFVVTLCRLSEQAQRHLQDSERFEDILLGASRPTMVVQRYDELFSQARVDALDAIEEHLKTNDVDGAFGIDLVLNVFKVGIIIIILALW